MDGHATAERAAPGQVLALDGYLNSSGYSDLPSAISAASTAGRGLLITNDLALTGNVRIVIPISIVPGSGSITQSGSYILAISGPLAGSPGCLVGFSPGQVTFGVGSVDMVYPEWWGAVPDGVTDSAIAIRNAVASLPNGGVIHLSAGSYSLNSYDPTPLSTDEYVVLAVPANITLQGAANNATALKMAPALPGQIAAIHPLNSKRISFIGTRKGTSAQIIRDILFDYNGILLTYAFNSFNAVQSQGGKILLERLHIQNAPGRNMIVTATNATIRDVTIVNGDQNVPGNTLANDASFVYLNGADNLVENSHFYNISPAVTNCGGIEVHATNTVVRNNYFSNLWPAMYVGYGDHINVSYKNVIEENQFITNNGGVELIDRNVGAQVRNNYFAGNGGCGPTSTGRWSIFTPRNSNTGIASAGIQAGLQITGNTFDGNDLISVAGIQNSIISHNRFKACTCSLFLQSSDLPTKNVLITSNEFIDPPSYPGPYPIGQIGFDGGPWKSVYENILIKNNLFVSDRTVSTPTNQYAVVAGGIAAYTTMTNIIYAGNSRVNLNGDAAGAMANFITGDTPTAYTSVWNQPSGVQPAIGNGRLAGWYTFAGNTCTVQIQLVAGVTTTWGNNSTPYQFSLPLPASKRITQQRLSNGASVFDSVGSQNYEFSVTIAAGARVLTLSRNGQAMRLDYPVPWATGDTITVSLVYFTE
jgi:hypothetical protein